jgi:hypothetical protein
MDIKKGYKNQRLDQSSVNKPSGFAYFRENSFESGR